MKILDPNIVTAGSHSRASTATFIGSDGLLQTAGVDVPRLQYNPLNLAEAPSYLFEAAATNLLFRSEADSGWAALGTTPPTVNSTNTTVDGVVCTSTTFPVTTGGTFASGRVTGTSSTGSINSGVTINQSSWIKISRALVGAEQITFLITGTFGGSNFLLTATNSAQFLAWARSQGATLTPTLTGSDYFVIIANTLTSPITVFSSRRQIETGSVATSYIVTPTTAAVTRAADLSTAGVVASSVLENDHPAYNPLTNYAALVRVVSASSIYESAQTPNTGNTPATSPLFWTRISATNRMKMFDGEVSTLTTATSFISVVVAPGLVDSLAVFAALGAQLRATGTDGLGGPVVYNKTISLDASTVGDWYEWTYQPFLPVTTIVLSDLPLYGSLHVSVTISGVGTVAMGLLAFGRIEAVGNTQHGLSVDVRESKRTNTALKYLTTRLEGPQTDFDRVVRLIEKLRSKTIVLVSTDVPGYESLNIFGKVQSWSVTAAGPNHYESDLTFEGSL